MEERICRVRLPYGFSVKVETPEADENMAIEAVLEHPAIKKIKDTLIVECVKVGEG